MHEMGLADAVLKTVERIRTQENAARVRSVTVELGDLSGVVPRFLAECWEAVTANTAYDGVELRLHPVPATARCEDCREVFVVSLDDLRCPHCRSVRLTPLSGRELTIAEIEVSEEDEP